MLSEYGDMASYDIGFARALARAAWDKPETYIKHMEAVCRMNTDGCTTSRSIGSPAGQAAARSCGSRSGAEGTPWRCQRGCGTAGW